VGEVLIKVENLYKIFGGSPEAALSKVKQGQSKSEVLASTGNTVGLKDISLDIKRGEIFVIMGLSGSGKSTLIRHFNRIIEPTAGRILIEDTDVVELGKKQLREFRQKQMAMVFQHFGLLPHYTVIENVAFGLKIKGMEKAQRMAAAKQWLADVGLAGYEDQYPSQLSGGQQQRVGLARALCANASILLMDEAFSALDPLIRSEMQDQLLQLQEKLKKTIVFITHDLDESLRLGDRIAILRDGELVQVGTPQQILLEPADEYVETFVRDVNRARALTVENVMKPPASRLTAATIGQALTQMKASSAAYAYLENDNGFQGYVLQETLRKIVKQTGQEHTPLCGDHCEESLTISPDALLEEVIPDTLDNEYPLPVVDDQGELKGELSRQHLAEALVATH